MSRRIRILALILSVVTGALPGVAHAARDSVGGLTSEPVRLGGRNAIAVSRSSVLSVTIPQRAILSAEWGSNPDFSVSGGGYLTGFVLRRESSSEEASVVLGFRLPREGAFGKRGVEVIYSPSEDLAGGIELAAGTYDLYIVAERAAVLKLVLPGLRGSVDVVARGPAQAQVQELTDRLSGPDPAASYSAGDEGRLSASGMTFFAHAFTGPAWAAGSYGACVHRGATEAPPEVRYAPWCPAAEDAAIVSTSDTVIRLQHRTIFFGSVIGLPADSWDITTWLTGAGAIDAVDSAGAWLSFG